MSASAKSSAQSAKRPASAASDHEPAIKKAKASKAKKEDGRAASTCKTLCGVVSNHTARGHNVQLQNEFSISPGDRRNWFLSHVLQGKLQNRVCNCNLAFDVIFLVNNQLPPVEFDVMLESVPTAKGKSASSQRLGCAGSVFRSMLHSYAYSFSYYLLSGRNFHALLTHEHVNIKEHALGWVAVFEWARSISEGQCVYVAGEIPDNIIAISLNEEEEAKRKPVSCQLSLDEAEHKSENEKEEDNESDELPAPPAGRRFKWKVPFADLELQSNHAQFGAALHQQQTSVMVPQNLLAKVYALLAAELK